jgi:hypothetical protein
MILFGKWGEGRAASVGCGPDKKGFFSWRSFCSAENPASVRGENPVNTKKGSRVILVPLSVIRNKTCCVSDFLLSVLKQRIKMQTKK